MNLLKLSLLSNATFSLLTGLTLIFFRHKVAHLFGKKKPTTFWILGIGLLLFSASVYQEYLLLRPERVLFIIIQDALWIIGSIIILGFRLFGISPRGRQAIIAVAFIVFLFGLGQSIGLAQTDNNELTRLKEFKIERIVKADKQTTWQVISDVGNYHKIAPNIDSVEIISGEGEGMIRKCTHGADHWTEVATLWQEGEKYSFEVDTKAPDYPYPLKHLKGTWTVTAVSSGETKILMEFEFAYKRKIHNLILHPFMRGSFNKICDELLDNWEKEIQQGTQEM